MSTEENTSGDNELFGDGDKHIITQEDLDNNPGLVGVVEVGEEVTLPETYVSPEAAKEALERGDQSGAPKEKEEDDGTILVNGVKKKKSDLPGWMKA